MDDRRQSAEEFSVPATLRRQYQFGPMLGRGANGVVYQGTRQSDGRAVAIKILSADSPDPVAAERFRREAELASRDMHPVLVKVLDSGCVDELHFIVSELVRGLTLREFLDEHGPMSERRTLEIAGHVADCLRCLHDRGITHRDIKPENIMLDEQGNVRLLDLGIARIAYANEQLTKTGVIIGTVLYLAPEQCRFRQATPAVDVFAAGLVMLECLAPRTVRLLPGQSATEFMVVRATGREDLRVPRHVAAPVGALVQKCLAFEPAGRYRDGCELRRAIVETERLLFDCSQMAEGRLVEGVTVTNDNGTTVTDANGISIADDNAAAVTEDDVSTRLADPDFSSSSLSKAHRDSVGPLSQIPVVESSPQRVQPLRVVPALSLATFLVFVLFCIYQWSLELRPSGLITATSVVAPSVSAQTLIEARAAYDETFAAFLLRSGLRASESRLRNLPAGISPTYVRRKVRDAVIESVITQLHVGIDGTGIASIARRFVGLVDLFQRVPAGLDEPAETLALLSMVCRAVHVPSRIAERERQIARRAINGDFVGKWGSLVKLGTPTALPQFQLLHRELRTLGERDRASRRDTLLIDLVLVGCMLEYRNFVRARNSVAELLRLEMTGTGNVEGRRCRVLAIRAVQALVLRRSRELAALRELFASSVEMIGDQCGPPLDALDEAGQMIAIQTFFAYTRGVDSPRNSRRACAMLEEILAVYHGPAHRNGLLRILPSYIDRNSYEPMRKTMLETIVAAAAR